MLSYEIDPGVLRPFVPAGTELDDWNGQTFVSVVGFMFLDTRVLGVRFPWHSNFEEVNLRFYVRRKGSEGWRRGVVFIKELVPRFAIAWVARTYYGENYVALPMQHSMGNPDGPGPRRVSYSWWFEDRENMLELTVAGDGQLAAAGSMEEFVTEHYWGYARRKNGATTEYRVEHPRWQVFPAEGARLVCDVAGLYGQTFVEFMRSPVSAFLADGSQVVVHKGQVLPT